MAGLVPAIHVLLAEFKKDVDARNKCGHDDGEIDANRLGKVLPDRHERSGRPIEHR
jgi:hypothetical protein